MMNIELLPKVELHCHMDGILSPAMAATLRQVNPSFPIDSQELERAYPISGLESFFQWWQYIQPLDHDPDQYLWIVEHYIALLRSQNVRYFELMIAQGELPQDTAAAVDKMHQFRERANQCELGQIQVEFLLTFNRRHSAERIQSFESKILAMFEAGLIVGVALAGPEIGNPVQPFTRSFARFHEAGLGIEIHAGEWVGTDSVWDALEYGYPDRIGHGVALFNDPRLVALFQERQIHIEMCPTSNLQTGSIARIQDHPIRKARDLGLNFSINSDDPGVFGCSIESEYRLVTEVFNFDEADWMRVYRNSLASRFQKTLRIPDQ
jgi:adenosine deaminase